MRLLFSVISATLLSPVAFAQSDGPGSWYAGAGYEHIEKQNAELGSIGMTVGYNFNEHFAAEASAAFGVEDDTQFYPASSSTSGDMILESPSLRISTDHDFSYEVLGVGKLPLSERIRLIGKLGVARTRFTSTFEYGATSTVPSSSARYVDNDTSVVAGVGVEFDVLESLALDIGYKSYIEFHNEGDVQQDDTLDVLRIGIKKKF